MKAQKTITLLEAITATFAATLIVISIYCTYLFTIQF